MAEMTEEQVESANQKLWDELDAADLDVPGQTLAQTLATDAPEVTGLEADAKQDEKDEAAAVDAEVLKQVSGQPPSDTARPSPAKDTVAAPPEKTAAEQVAELNRTIAALSNELRQVNGRVGGLQGELSKVKAMKAEAAVANVAPASNGPSVQERLAAAKSPAKWEALKGDYPEWADGVEAYLESKLQAVAQPAAVPFDPAALEQRQAALVDERVQAAIAAQRDADKQAQATNQALDTAHPGWVQTINSDAFVAWSNAQPKGVRALAYSPDPEDAIAMIGMFKATQPQPAATGQSADEVAAARKKRLSQSVTPTRAVDTGPRSAVSLDDLNDEQVWKYYDRLEAAKARA